MTVLDFPCMLVSFLSMGVYVYTKNWLYNNVLAFLFCINALQTLFIGNFKNGFMLLILLFFYDIFFVFGTDVMLTVAKGIEGPIKLMFPKNYSTALDKPQYSILGLGDIVIPGAFVSMCLRFDILKLVNQEKFVGLVMEERKQEGEPGQTVKYLASLANTSKLSYFIATNIGYLFAIIATIIVMIFFEHGQPALLYLVPGVIIAVLLTSCAKGEYTEMWEFTEEPFITPESEDKDDDKKEK